MSAANPKVLYLTSSGLMQLWVDLAICCPVSVFIGLAMATKQPGEVRHEHHYLGLSLMLHFRTERLLSQQYRQSHSLIDFSG
jgi:hypothetical protein